MHACIHAGVHACTSNACMLACMRACIHVECMYAGVHACMRASMYAYACMRRAGIKCARCASVVMHAPCICAYARTRVRASASTPLCCMHACMRMCGGVHLCIMHASHMPTYARMCYEMDAYIWDACICVDAGCWMLDAGCVHASIHTRDLPVHACM